LFVIPQESAVAFAVAAAVALAVACLAAIPSETKDPAVAFAVAAAFAIVLAFLFVIPQESAIAFAVASAPIQRPPKTGTPALQRRVS
jgi:hypothetical protein